MIVIADSSPLILLVRINQLSLLRALFSRVVVPTAVYRETVGQGHLRPGAAEIAGVDWISTEQVTDELAVRVLRQQIGPGESEAIVLALQLKADLLLIDDAKGRRIAESYGVAAVGTIGILIEAKRFNLIPAVKPNLNALQKIGLRMDRQLYEHALRLCGEEPNS